MNIDLLDRITENCMNNMGDVRYTEDFVQNRLKNSIEMSNLPFPFYRDCLDTSKLPTRIMEMNCDLLTFIPNGINCVVTTRDYEDSGYLIANAMEYYVTQNIIKDEHIYSLLYIDTNIFLRDMKKLFDYGKADTVAQGLGYGYDIVANAIYDVDYVFWDRFGYIESEYDFNKIFEILTIRYHHCKGNMFFVNTTQFKEKFGKTNPRFGDSSDLRVVMNADKRLYSLSSLSDDIKKCMVKFADQFTSKRNKEDTNNAKD